MSQTPGSSPEALPSMILDEICRALEHNDFAEAWDGLQAANPANLEERALIVQAAEKATQHNVGYAPLFIGLLADNDMQRRELTLAAATAAMQSGKYYEFAKNLGTLGDGDMAIGKMTVNACRAAIAAGNVDNFFQVWERLTEGDMQRLPLLKEAGIAAAAAGNTEGALRLATQMQKLKVFGYETIAEEGIKRAIQDRQVEIGSKLLALLPGTHFRAAEYKQQLESL